MSEPQARAPGWYWVTFEGGEQAISKWHEWNVLPGGYWSNFNELDGGVVIGPRVPTPEELANMEQKIAALSAQVDDLLRPILNEADAAIEAPKRPSGTINVQLEHAERPFLEGK